MNDIHFAIITLYNKSEVHCIYNDFNDDNLVFRIRMRNQKKKPLSLDQQDEIYKLKNFQEHLMENLVIRGIANITKVIPRKIMNTMVEEDDKYVKKESWVLDTVGTNLMDILASYMQWYTENPNAFPNRYNCKNDEEKLMMIMNKEGAVAKDLEAIKNSYNYKDMCHYVKYDDMVTNPEQEFRKIYKFLGEPYFSHRFNNLDQVSVNGLSYNDKIVGSNMHKLFDGPVRKVYNPYIEKIPERIRQKYGHIRF